MHVYNKNLTEFRGLYLKTIKSYYTLKIAMCIKMQKKTKTVM